MTKETLTEAASANWTQEKQSPMNETGLHPDQTHARRSIRAVKHL